MRLMMNKIETEKEGLYGYEEFLYRCFKTFQNPDAYAYNRKVGNFSQYCFMSERFYLLYQVLLKKYPELKLPKDVYQAGKDIPNKPTLYINDCISEMPKEIGIEDKMQLICNSFYSNIIEDENAPWASSSSELLEMEKDSTVSEMIMQRLTTIIIDNETIGQSLNSLGCELQILKNYGISNAYDLAPISVRKYFHFIFENKEQISYYILNFYNVQRERDAIYDSQLAQIQLEIAAQLKSQFKENWNPKVVSFFSSVLPSFYYYLHYPINIDTKDIDSKLDFLDNPNLVSNHFKEYQRTRKDSE